MEDILYLSKEKVVARDIILVAKEFNYICDGAVADNSQMPNIAEIRVIPSKDTYWDFANYERSPDFKCLDKDDLEFLRNYAPASILVVTHSYNTRSDLVKFISKLIVQKGGGVVTDGGFDQIDELKDLDTYIKKHCKSN